MKNQYSCIVPVYNERPRVTGVLSAVSKVPQISEIICVDDGSTDGSDKEILKNFPGVSFIRHRYKKGKGFAIRTAIRRVMGERCILIDSDLSGLQKQDIDRTIELYERHRLDCLLLCTRPVFWIDVILRGTIRLPHLMTGCRIIRTEDLKEIVMNKVLNGYNLEIQENKFLMDRRRRIAYTGISAKNVLKVQKKGIVQGVVDDIRMWKEIFTGVSPREVFRQIIFFGREKLE